MKRISWYQAPTPDDFIHLKSTLQFTSEQMADLANLAKSSQWRKYTGRTEKRVMGLVRHFYMAALLTLSPDELERIVATMESHGAVVELGPCPTGPRYRMTDHERDLAQTQ